MSEAVEDVADKLNAEAGRVFAIPFEGDTTDGQVPCSVFDAIGRKYCPVAWACRLPASPATSWRYESTRDRQGTHLSDRAVQARVDVNLIAPVYWALEMIGRVAEDRAATGLKRWTPDEGMQGAVVFIGSISSQGNRGQISYASTKAGLEGAASTITMEALYHGVRCSVIHPASPTRRWCGRWARRPGTTFCPTRSSVA